MFPIHLASGSSIVRRFIHLTSTPNGLHSERAFDMRALTKENYGLPVILDITAVLSISKFKLWNAMRESGLVYKLPGSVYQTLRKERDELKLCRVRDIESRLKGYKELMAHPKVESVPRLNPVEDFKDGDLHTYEELNMRLLSERGGDFCDSFADVNNQVWTIPKLIRSALLTGKFTASQEYSLRAKLEPHLENVMWDQESHGEFPAKIMFSGLDLDALSQIPESKLILDLFETVYVGPGNHFEIGLLIGAGSHIETSFEFSSIAFSELEAAISQGIVTMQKDLNRPDCDSPLYLMELCAMAEKEKCDVWVDDSATRGLLAGQAISAFSNSTQSMVEHLHSSGVLSITKVNDLRIELLREGYRDSLWQQSLVYAAETPAHQKSFEIIVKRLCCGILPGLYRTQYELQEYLSFLWANLYALCTRCPELEPYLRIATNVALEFTGKLTLHVWGALFDELTKLDGYWIEDYVEWASELAVKNGAFTYGTFIELAISSVELKRAFPILEQGRNKEAFMRIWRILRERRAGITIKCLDQ